MGNLHLRFDEGRVGRATGVALSYSTGSVFWGTSFRALTKGSGARTTPRSSIPALSAGNSEIATSL